jgi:hypothetical protein
VSRIPSCSRNYSRWAPDIRQSGAPTTGELREVRVMHHQTRIVLTLLLAAAIAACVNDTELRKREIQKFQQTAGGEYHNEAGDTLFLVPVYARMIGLDTMYVERTTKKGTSNWLLVLEPSSDGEKIVQIAYAFTQQNQWKNLRETPELLSALQPNDVRPIGSCDIQLAKDMNSVSYACNGNPPQNYTRIQHHVDN